MGKFETNVNSVIGSFLTTPEATKPEQKKAPKVKKEEVKAKRVQLLVRPSDYEAIKEKAWQQRISTNEAINRAIKDYLKRR